MTFILAMLTHPDVQRKAQQEVDSVIGSDRLPDFSDQQNLPYLAAVLKEILRSVASLLQEGSLINDIPPVGTRLRPWVRYFSFNSW